MPSRYMSTDLDKVASGLHEGFEASGDRRRVTSGPLGAAKREAASSASGPVNKSQPLVGGKRKKKKGGGCCGGSATDSDDEGSIASPPQSAISSPLASVPQGLSVLDSVPTDGTSPISATLPISSEAQAPSKPVPVKSSSVSVASPTAGSVGPATPSRDPESAATASSSLHEGAATSKPPSSPPRRVDLPDPNSFSSPRPLSLTLEEEAQYQATVTRLLAEAAQEKRKSRSDSIHSNRSSGIPVMVGSPTRPGRPGRRWETESDRMTMTLPNSLLGEAATEAKLARTLRDLEQAKVDAARNETSQFQVLEAQAEAEELRDKLAAKERQTAEAIREAKENASRVKALSQRYEGARLATGEATDSVVKWQAMLGEAAEQIASLEAEASEQTRNVARLERQIFEHEARAADPEADMAFKNWYAAITAEDGEHSTLSAAATEARAAAAAGASADASLTEARSWARVLHKAVGELEVELAAAREEAQAARKRCDTLEQAAKADVEPIDLEKGANTFDRSREDSAFVKWWAEFSAANPNAMASRALEIAGVKGIAGQTPSHVHADAESVSASSTLAEARGWAKVLFAAVETLEEQLRESREAADTATSSLRGELNAAEAEVAALRENERQADIAFQNWWREISISFPAIAATIEAPPSNVAAAADRGEELERRARAALEAAAGANESVSAAELRVAELLQMETEIRASQVARTATLTVDDSVTASEIEARVMSEVEKRLPSIKATVAAQLQSQVQQQTVAGATTAEMRIQDEVNARVTAAEAELRAKYLASNVWSDQASSAKTAGDGATKGPTENEIEARMQTEGEVRLAEAKGGRRQSNPFAVDLEPESGPQPSLDSSNPFETRDAAIDAVGSSTPTQIQVQQSASDAIDLNPSTTFTSEQQPSASEEVKQNWKIPIC